VTEIVSIERDGPLPARRALERCTADGGVAIFPADTVYGIACDPSRADAIARVNAIKGRPDTKPSAVMFFSPLAMRELVSSLGPRTRDALGALLPGPVTLVVANPQRLYANAAREDPERLGIRLIGGPLAGSDSTVFQTSANRSGQPSALRFEDIDPEIIGAVDLAIDGGDLGGEPSTVVDLGEIEGGGEWAVLREGAMPLPEVESRLAGVGLDRR
jgi:L-threonylcarbamoyladenylate synthase